MFQKGDRVKCIKTASHLPELILGNDYTVDSYNPAATAAPVVSLIELPGMVSYIADRFVLVSSVCHVVNIHNNDKPTGIMSPLAQGLKELAEDLRKQAESPFTHGVASQIAKIKCECGIDSLGGGKHSDYCPKYSRE